MGYASQKWTKDFVGQTLKTAKDRGLLGGGGGSDEVYVGAEEPTDLDIKIWADTSESREKKFTGDVYSTEETVVGTWIDGKPIYRKVIVSNNVTIPKSGSFFMQIGASIQDYVSKHIMAKESSNGVFRELPLVHNVAVGNQSMVALYNNEHTGSPNTLEISQGSSVARTFSKVIAILEYTKTTD